MNEPRPRVPATAVVGLQFGDEGKGQITDLLAQSHDVIVRYNGGANAGHSVHVGDRQYALHQVPLGVLTPGRSNVLANGVALDPDALGQEMHALRSMGVVIGDNLRISDRAHLVMPYHKVEERLRELLAKMTLGSDQILGTTGRGIGPCYADKASRDTAVRVADLFADRHLHARLAHIVIVKNAILAALAKAAGVVYEPLTVDDLRALCATWADSIGPFACDVSTWLDHAMRDGARVLFEGAHAALLDIDHGTFPFVTSSNSSVLGICAGTGIPPARVGDVIGVAKLYTSRVGTGPFPTEFTGELADSLRTRAGEYGTSTGRPRRLGWLDIPALRMAARLNGVSALCLTGLAMLAGLPYARVCVAYRHRGEMLDTLPASVTTLDEMAPLYEDFAGFDGPIDRCGSFGELPAAARALVELIEQRVAPVGWVCVGRRRDQVLKR